MCAARRVELAGRRRGENAILRDPGSSRTIQIVRVSGAASRALYSSGSRPTSESELDASTLRNRVATMNHEMVQGHWSARSSVGVQAHRANRPPPTAN